MTHLIECGWISCVELFVFSWFATKIADVIATWVETILTNDAVAVQNVSTNRKIAILTLVQRSLKRFLGFRMVLLHLAEK